MIWQPGQHVSEPRLRINIVHLGRDDQTVHDSGSLSAAIRGNAIVPGATGQTDMRTGMQGLQRGHAGAVASVKLNRPDVP
jgi:hypothetical protein